MLDLYIHDPQLQEESKHITQGTWVRSFLATFSLFQLLPDGDVAEKDLTPCIGKSSGATRLLQLGRNLTQSLML